MQKIDLCELESLARYSIIRVITWDKKAILYSLGSRKVCMRLWLKTGADLWEDLSIDDTVIYLTYVGRRVWNKSD